MVLSNDNKRHDVIMAVLHEFLGDSTVERACEAALEAANKLYPVNVVQVLDSRDTMPHRSQRLPLEDMPVYCEREEFRACPQQIIDTALHRTVCITERGRVVMTITRSAGPLEDENG